MKDSKLRYVIREKVKRLIKEEKFEYESVEESDADPQPEVKKAIERFREMDPEERRTNNLLYWLIGKRAGTPPYKMSQEDAQYSDDGGTQETACANCEFLYQKTTSGKYICSQIRGEVRPEGWCNRWKLADTIKENGE